MGLFGSSFKLTAEQKKVYYDTLKDLYKVLGHNYKASALLFENLKVLELHTDNKITKKDFEKLNVVMIKRLKKMNNHKMMNIEAFYPFDTIVLSLKDSFLTLVSSNKFVFSFLCEKNNLNIGSVYNIVLPKAKEMLSKLDVKDQEVVEQNQNFD